MALVGISVTGAAATALTAVFGGIVFAVGRREPPRAPPWRLVPLPVELGRRPDQAEHAAS